MIAIICKILFWIYLCITVVYALYILVRLFRMIVKDVYYKFLAASSWKLGNKASDECPEEKKYTGW